MSYGSDPFVWDGGGALSDKAKAQKLRERSEQIAKMLMQQEGDKIDTSPVGHWTQGAARVADALFGAINRGRDEKAASGYSAQADQIDAAGRAKSAKTFAPLQEFFSGDNPQPASYAPGQIEQRPLVSGQVPVVNNDWLQYNNKNAIRNQPINSDLQKGLSFLPDMGVTMNVFSGGQDATGPHRTGSHRHDGGNAADVFFSKGGKRLDWRNPADIPILQDIVSRAKAAGVTGFGAGDGYMQPGSMHIGFGKPAVWGAGGKGANAPEWLNQAFNRKSAPQNQIASNDPTFMPASAPPAISAMPPQLQQSTQAQQMPQNAQAQEPALQAPQPSNMPTAAQLMAVMSDEYSSDAQKFAAKQMLDHVMQLDPRLQDPLERQNKQLQIEQAQGNLKKQPLELYQLQQNINLARTKEERDAAMFKYDQALKQGQIDKQPIELDQAKANLANTGKTGAIQEYEYSQKNPNFKPSSSTAGEITADQKNYNFAIQQLKERGVPDAKLPTFQEWAKPKSRGISFKSADGTEIQIGGDATGDSGLQGTSIPAEVGSRIGLGQEFLEKDYPNIIKMIKDGDATGPVNYAAGYFGRGNSGIVQRRMATGIDSLRRSLTGAGMSQGEAKEMAGRYAPLMTDDAETLMRKAEGLKQDLEAAAKGAIRGKAGDVNSLLPKDGAPKIPKYNPQTGDFE
jgi:hypothetical protein